MSDKQRHILVVDDERLWLRSLDALLRQAGYAVSTALGGREAIRRLQSEDFDLVLLDLNMPQVNGLDVLAYLRDRGLDCCAVVISGENGFEWVSQAFRLGAYDYLEKPFEVELLLSRLARALEKRELERGYKLLRRQLERSERLHRFMIDSSPDLIFIVDREGCFAFVNDRAQDLLGYSKEELLGLHYSKVVAPGSRDKAAHCFTERGGEDRPCKDVEIWLLCKPDGARKYADEDRIAIELNSAGVYEIPEDSEADGGDDTFSGTYVVGRDITEKLASQKLIHYQAYHDLLTGLPNRALLMDRLNMAIRSAKRRRGLLATMFLDLDRFKMVNDSLGHSVGDKLLQGVARRLRHCLREADTLARLGGDEFVVLLPSIESDEVPQIVAEKILLALKEPLQLEGQEIFVTASVGIAVFPRDGDSADTLIKHADIAMYHTKDQGKNGYFQFEDAMSIRQHKRLSLENEIRRGMRDDQFEVYYQPQVNPFSGRVTGVEALLRWEHPERGLLSPAFFLGVAEESGLIVELGDWVLKTALQEMRQWRAEGIVLDKLAVNFSPRQMEQKDFVDKIVSLLHFHGYPPRGLEIEITEGTIMSDMDDIIGKLRQLHEVGVHVAIDDFGTGYSSLSLLQKLPLNRLKIDRSFIQSMTIDSDRSIIEAIAHMAKGLKLGMVAEGVEEEFQLEYLKELDCPAIQGFIYSEGLPGPQARARVASGGLPQVARRLNA